MEIRRAELADLAWLAAKLGPLPLFRRYGLTEKVLEERWTRALGAGERLWVALFDGAPQGLSWYLPSGTFASGAYLRTLAVAQAAQGRGVGLGLLKAFEAASRDAAGGCFLLTAEFNTAAQKFYERHGYRQVGKLPGFAMPEVTELIYWRRKESR